MRFLIKPALFTGTTILGLLACSSASNSGAMGVFGPGMDEAADGGTSGAFGGGATCTEDAGVLTPIGPQGCGANQTIVYRKPPAGSGASSISSAAGTPSTPQLATVTACTDTKCGPGQVAVVTYQATIPSDPLADASGGAGDDAGDVDGAGSALDGATSVADAGAVPSTGDDGAPDGEASEASAVATADASGTAASAGDAGVIGIPCGAVVTCVSEPPTCPAGQSPSYTPAGRWHCMPNCDASNPDTVVITYGGTYGNTTTCAPAPPTNGCSSPDVWTWDYANEQWVCAPECDNGQYDQHSYNGQTVCVPC